MADYFYSLALNVERGATWPTSMVRELLDRLAGEEVSVTDYRAEWPDDAGLEAS